MPRAFCLAGRAVRLEPLDIAHVDGLVAAATESGDTYGFTRVPSERNAMRSYVEAALSEWWAGLSVPFATVDAGRGRVVGATRFLDLERWGTGSAGHGGTAGVVAAPSVAEIGATWLAASAQRTVLNTEAKYLMLRHAFEEWRVHRVTLQTDARNERSRVAIERLGARFEGIRRAHKLATDGSVRDTAYYSVVAAEWPAVRDGLLQRLGERGAGGTTPGGTTPAPGSGRAAKSPGT